MKTTKTRTIILLVINFFIILIMLGLVGINNIQLAIENTKAHWIYPMIFFIVFSFAFVLRSIRWKLITPAPTHLNILLRSLLAAWFLNAITPARLGDASRIYILKLKENIDIGKGTTSLLVDRALDIIALIIMLLVVFIFFPINISGNIGLLYILSSTMFVVAILGLIVVVLYKPKLIKQLFRIVFSPFPRLLQFFNSFIDKFNQGIKDMKFLGGPLLIAILLSFVIWFLESISIFLFANALGFKLLLTTAIIAAIFGFLAMTIPILPGGFGTYEGAIVAILLVLTNLSFESALLLALVDHIFRQLYFIILGGISLQSFGISIPKLDSPPIESTIPISITND